MRQGNFPRPNSLTRKHNKEKTIVINPMMKGLALCGMAVLLAGAASAQGNDHFGGMHPGMHPARHAIMRQKAAYARAVAHGNYAQAERDHLRAKAIRQHVRARREMHQDMHREMHQDMHRDHGY